ncbi:hypothetical protein L9F63_007590, partial [Diploptera punctata]
KIFGAIDHVLRLEVPRRFVGDCVQHHQTLCNFPRNYKLQFHEQQPENLIQDHNMNSGLDETTETATTNDDYRHQLSQHIFPIVLPVSICP